MEKETKVIFSKECTDCVFCVENMMEAGYHCRIDEEERIIESKTFRPVTPKWCPLSNKNLMFKKLIV